MNTQAGGGDKGLMRRFYLTELFANVFGAPLIVAYGGFMIDFSRVALGDFLLKVLLVMVVNQIFLALPINFFLGKSMRLGLAAWRSGALDETGRARLFSSISRLPLLQAALIFARMFLAAAASLLLISSQFDLFLHIAAVFVFSLYSSFIAGLMIYYYLYDASSRAAEELFAGLPAGGAEAMAEKSAKSSLALTYLPLMVPTAITSLGIFLLVMVISQGPPDMRFFMVRIVAALIMNVLTVSAIMIFSQLFHNKRLKAIQSALEDMIENGDTSRRIPTDMSDDYAFTAHRINHAFDLFRLVLSQMDSASGRLSETVMSFSSQMRETVAATTQQASAVKEVVSTMEGSNRINRQIREQAEALSENAHESQSMVDDGFGKVQDTIHKMDEIKGANVQTLGEIGELTEEISSIGEIIEIINGIANQTRIIAFNAELEASSAGTAGISFRIVAEEIRRLANSTVDSLVGIKDRIAQIQQGSERLLATSEEGTGKIEEGLHLSADLNDIFMRIRLSAENTFTSASGISQILVEQNQAFDQIFMTLKQISEGAEQVLASSRITGTDVSRLKDLIDELKGVLTRFDYDVEGPPNPNPVPEDHS